MQSILRTFAIAAASAASAAAFAAPTIFTFTATATGFFNGSIFEHEQIRITAHGNTDHIAYDSEYSVYKMPVTAHVAIESLGQDWLTGDLQVFCAPHDIVGLSDNTEYIDIIDVINPSVGDYQLDTPVNALTGLPIINSNRSYGTTGGRFQIVTIGVPTFTAQVVPEPAPLAALAGGALMLLRRRRGRTKA